jgi:DNA invertase Pin-like site-specific DNA recombinase
MTKAKRAAIYLRVSTTAGQTVENQRRELHEAAERHGWQIVAEFCDEGISGAKGRDKRPALDKLLRTVARREVDLVAAWSVDRLGRSLQDLVVTLNELRAKGVDLYLHKQGLDTSTPHGKAMYGMLSVFAEFERDMIVERVNAGLARAKASGTKSGKAIGRPKVAGKVEELIKAELAKGTGVLKAAKLLGVGTGTVQRIKAEMAA